MPVISRFLLFLALILFTGLSVQASHLVGGYMRYECLGNNNYRFTVHIVRDCFGNNAPYDNAVNFTVYAGNNLNFPFTTATAFLNSNNITSIPITATNPCLIPPTNLCIQDNFYQVVINLPFNANGYYIAHQRCCRNSTVTNIFNPGALGSVGNTFMIFLSAAAQANQSNGTCGNSSPVFNEFPPAVICTNQDINYNVGASDVNGDSLVYYLCAPYAGGGAGNPAPNPSTPPPYTGVVFIGPTYSGINPLGTNPPISINPQTGLISGIPTIPGQFVVGVCVDEYRNGVLFSQTRRDFQFNVTSCAQVVNANLDSDVFEASLDLHTIYSCGDTIIEFFDLSTNQNFIDSWSWTFFKNGNFFASDSTQNPVVNFQEPGFYTGKLVVNPGSSGCTDSTQINVVIYPDMIANFNFVYDSCAFVPVDFTDLSTPLGNNEVVAWLWDFNDGFTSSLQNPEHLYDTTLAGDFTITLTATDNNGCTKDTFKVIEYYPSPIIQIDADTFQGCSPFFIQFSNNSYPISGYTTLWILGDGDSAFVASPAHFYEDPGEYTVIIQITSPVNGCVSRDTFIDLIKVEPIPQAIFTIDFDSCEQIALTFFESSIDTGTLPIILWIWDFGDGTDTTLNAGANLQHTYADAGTYEVSLTVSDAIGCSSTLIEEIEYYPAAQINVVPSGLEGCNSLEVSFDNLSSPLTGYDVLWDFGDGNTSTDDSPVHFYADTGIYTVTLTITSPTGCVSQEIFENYVSVWPLPQPAFEIGYDTCSLLPVQLTNQSFNVGSGAAINSWIWDFGDGATASGQNQTHQYSTPGTYPITLVLTDLNGCIDSITQSLEWFPAAVVEFEADEVSGCESLPVNFSNLSEPSMGYDFLWNFGNGNTSTQENPTITYPSTGFFDVTLQVTSPTGCVSELTLPEYIKVYNNPVANFDYAYDTCNVAPVSFFDTSEPGDGPIVNWLWDFGDGLTSNLPSTTHLFDSAGFLIVSLTVTDIYGCSNSASIETGWFPNPIVTISPNTNQGCEPLEVFFENTSYPINGYTTFWEFGDGGTSFDASPTYTYETPGIYTVMLTITAPPGSPGNCVSIDTFVDLINVNASGIIGFDVVYDECSAINPIQFVDKSQAGGSPIYYWDWDFGDGNTSVEPSPQHQYDLPGIYEVSLTLTDSIGCDKTLIDTIEYFPASDIDISWEIDGNCAPADVSFTNNTTYFISPEYNINWNFGNGTSSSEFEPEITFQQGGQFTLTVTTTSPSGCVSSRVYENFKIDPPPIANFTIDWDSCALDPLQFIDLSNPGGQFLTDWIWSYGDSAKSNLQNPQHNYLNPGTYNIFLVVRDNNDCYDTTAVQTINYFPAPLIDMEPDRWEDCAAATIDFYNLSLPVTDAYNSLWSFGDGNSASIFEGNHIYTTGGDFQVTLTMSSPTGCTAARTFDRPIRIAPPFVAEIITNPDPFTQFDEEILVSALPGTIEWHEWQLNSQHISFQPDFAFSPEAGEDYLITLYATHLYGCTDTVQRLLQVAPELRFFLPTAFSPDENGENDIYKGKGSLQGILSYTMEIYNRWGERVFLSNNPDIGWNGRKNNTSSRMAEQGVYVCVVQITDAQGVVHRFREHLMLVR